MSPAATAPRSLCRWRAASMQAEHPAAISLPVTGEKSSLSSAPHITGFKESTVLLESTERYQKSLEYTVGLKEKNRNGSEYL